MKKALIITYIFQLFSFMCQAQGVVEKNDLYRAREVDTENNF